MYIDDDTIHFDYWEALELEAEELYNEDNWYAALKIYDILAIVCAENLDYYFDRAIIYLHLGDATQVLENLKAAGPHKKEPPFDDPANVLYYRFTQWIDQLN
ncbi:MAG: hypothetical protein OCD01_04460 [Fibrobacterales bacterium]